MVHYTTRGTEDTAVEIDKIGKDGLKAMDGAIKGVDRGGKKLVVKTADGTDSTCSGRNQASGLTWPRSLNQRDLD